MFSKACEYAIRATIFIAGQSLLQKKVGQKEIAHAIDSPEAFTAKTLQKLTKNKIINSEKGPNGGFFLTDAQLSSICLFHIVEAIDGNEIFTACGLGLQKCNEKKPCPVHHQFKVIRDQLTQMLENTSVQSMAIQIKKGATFLKQ